MNEDILKTGGYLYMNSFCAVLPRETKMVSDWTC